MNRLLPLFVTSLALTAMLTACNKEEKGGDTAAERAVAVSVSAVRSEPVDELELSDGRIESLRAPTINSEVAGRVVRVVAERGQVVKAGQVLAQLNTTDLKLSARAARADAARLEPMVANQQSTVARYQSLRKDGLISQEMLDTAEAQLATLKQQLSAARNQAALAVSNLQKADITAPFAGQIEERLISEGDYLDRGKPAFRLVAATHLQAKLPFPETVLGRIRVDQPVRLTAAGRGGEPLNATITAVSPHIDPSNNAFYATVEFVNPGDWHPGSSVTAEVVVATRPKALLVPQVSVVRRPAGDVVYVIKGSQVEQHVVVTGVTVDGWVEIRSGIAPDDQVVTDGSAYLSDKAAIKVQEARQ
jgi:RND family efflux transporter MFP subunit